MKLIYFFLLGLLLFNTAQAQNQFGLGAVLGDPTGISLKANMNHGWIDGIFAYSSGPASTYYLSGDYGKTRRDLFRVDLRPIDFYYGIGFRIYESGGSDNRKFHIGPKAPVGLSHKWDDPSVEAYIEAALILDLAPSTSGDLDAGIGVRYWF